MLRENKGLLQFERNEVLFFQICLFKPLGAMGRVWIKFVLLPHEIYGETFFKSYDSCFHLKKVIIGRPCLRAIKQPMVCKACGSHNDAPRWLYKNALAVLKFSWTKHFGPCGVNVGALIGKWKESQYSKSLQQLMEIK